MIAKTSVQGSDQKRLIDRVIKLAWITILCSVLESIVSIIYGVRDESISLAGFGFQSLIEVASATLVLWRFKAEVAKGKALGEKRERRATLLIGIMFILITVAVAGAAAHQLIQGNFPETTFPGVVISLVTSGIMLSLWSAKKKLGILLDSPAVLADAECTIACFKISVVLLAGSLLFALNARLWWVDSAAAIVLAVMIGREGREMITASQKKDFSGGCCT